MKKARDRKAKFYKKHRRYYVSDLLISTIISSVRDWSVAECIDSGMNEIIAMKV